MQESVCLWKRQRAVFLRAEKPAFHHSGPRDSLYHAIVCSRVFLISLKKLQNCSPAAAENNFCIAVAEVAFPVFADANTGVVTYGFTTLTSWQ